MYKIRLYLEQMFRQLPDTEPVRRAKDELYQMMEDKYSDLISDGLSEDDAARQVISEFGNIDELAEELGLGEYGAIMVANTTLPTSETSSESGYGSDSYEQSADYGSRTDSAPLPGSFRDTQDYSRPVRQSSGFTGKTIAIIAALIGGCLLIVVILFSVLFSAGIIRTALTHTFQEDVLFEENDDDDDDIDSDTKPKQTIETDSYDSVHLKLRSLSRIRFRTGDSYQVAYSATHQSLIPRISVQNGTLYVTQKSDHNLIQFGHSECELIVSCPKGTTLSSVVLEADAAEAQLNDLSADTITLTIDAGTIEMKRIEAGELELTVDTGNIELDKVTSERAALLVDLGEISIDHSDIQALTAHVDLGDIEIEHLAEAKKASVSLTTDLGSIRFYDQKSSRQLKLDGSSNRTITASVDAGDISIKN